MVPWTPTQLETDGQATADLIFKRPCPPRQLGASSFSGGGVPVRASLLLTHLKESLLPLTDPQGRSPSRRLAMPSSHSYNTPIFLSDLYSWSLQDNPFNLQCLDTPSCSNGTDSLPLPLPRLFAKPSKIPWTPPSQCPHFPNSPVSSAGVPLTLSNPTGPCLLLTLFPVWTPRFASKPSLSLSLPTPAPRRPPGPAASLLTRTEVQKLLHGQRRWGELAEVLDVFGSPCQDAFFSSARTHAWRWRPLRAWTLRGQALALGSAQPSPVPRRPPSSPTATPTGLRVPANWLVAAP